MEFVEVDVCIYCEKEIDDEDPKYCCMWIEWFDYLNNEDFSCSAFKKKVANYHTSNKKLIQIKKKDAGYDKDDNYGFEFPEDSIELK
jgi:hypothetical protein